MNQPQTPDNEVAEVSMPSDKSMLTAQSDSVELYHALCDRSDDFSKALDACRDYRKQLDEKTNEVARLREELEIFKVAAKCSADSSVQARASLEKSVAENQKLRDLLERALKDMNLYGDDWSHNNAYQIQEELNQLTK